MLVPLAAIAMGLPTLGGTFVGSDDHRLVLNHVLVNHPSLAHAVMLLKIVHRDLYQPLPLLSFSAEFAVANTFGLFDEGVAAGAWLFHLTNVLLHALNAVLVWFVIRTLQQGSSGGDRDGRSVQEAPATIATIAALLFAIHPLQVEVVAWINGRMMLLSTLFALASLLTAAAYLRSGRWKWAIGTVLFVLLCMISKVRVGLPLLLLIPLIQIRPGPRGVRSTPRLWGFGALWLACAALTAYFALINIEATARSGLFVSAAEEFHGSRVVRVVLAIEWYLEHLVRPVGLASWYPAPAVARWSDPATVRAVLILIPVSLGVGWACRRRREALWGLAWFLVTIASTLPIVPARNMLAADRYMYLPIIGLLWLIATSGFHAWERVVARRSLWFRRALPVVLGVAVALALLATSWRLGPSYATSIAKTERIASLFPETPHVWARLGWSYHKAGNAAELVGRSAEAARHHEESIRCGRRELTLKDPGGFSEARQVIGMSLLKLGRVDEAIRSLKRAVEITSESAEAKFRLALAYDELGRFGSALPLYETAVASAPGHNPTVLRLAKVYRYFDRPDDARRMYEQVLRHNPYDVPATLGLAELDIERATHESYEAAQTRLLALLDWMPENTGARIDLGVVHQAMGRTDEAIETYRQVLTINARDAIAALNLAQLYRSRGDVAAARPLFEQAAGAPLETIDQAIAVHDFFIADQRPHRAVTLWAAYVSRFPASTDGRLFHAWSLALTGALPQAEALASEDIENDSASPLALATVAYVALAEARYDVATVRVAALTERDAQGADPRRRLLQALETFDRNHPDIPWTFCLAARLLIAEGKREGAAAFTDLCEQRCDDPTCRTYVAALRRSVNEPS